MGCPLSAAAITLDGTSGSNTDSTAYSTTGGLDISLGFFSEYLIVAGGGGGGISAYGGGAVDWTDSFWATAHTGTGGWLLYDVTGTTSNPGNLSITLLNWLDSNSVDLQTARPDSSFSFFQSGNDIYLNYNPSAIPEPASASLLLIGGASLLARIRRRKRSS